MITVYTDGCCLANPSGPGGYGIVICCDNVRVERSQGFRSTTNNRMELSAILAALWEIPKDKPIMIYCDSKYSIGVASGSMNPTKNLDLVTEIRSQLEGRDVTFNWVKGHNGNPYNERCDELAGLAATSSNLLIDAGFEEPEKWAAS